MNYGLYTLTNFGLDDRLQKAIEEMAELLVEITHYQKAVTEEKRSRIAIKMVEELADVQNVFMALETAANIYFPGKLEAFKLLKQKRTIKEIEKCGSPFKIDIPCPEKK